MAHTCFVNKNSRVKNSTQQGKCMINAKFTIQIQNKLANLHETRLGSACAFEDGRITAWLDYEPRNQNSQTITELQQDFKKLIIESAQRDEGQECTLHYITVECSSNKPSNFFTIHI